MLEISTDLQQADKLHCSPEKVNKEGQSPWWLAPAAQDLA